MPRYRIRAIDRSGKRTVSTIHAETENEAHLSLCERGWTVLSIKLLRANRRHQHRLQKASNASGGILFRQLGELLIVGVPLNTAVDEIRRLAPIGVLANAWARLSRLMDEGVSLVDAMESYPGLLAPRHLAVLNAGQNRQALAQALIDVGKELAWRAEILQRWKQVCIYPLFSIALLVTVCVFLITQVVPSLQPLLQPIVHSLPWMTQRILTLSNAVDQVDTSASSLIIYSLSAAIVILLCSILLASVLIKSKSMQSIWLNSGISQRWVWPFSVAVHAQTVHVLLKQNIPLPKALSLAAPAAAWFGTKDVWENVAQRVQHDGLWADAMKLESVVPKLYVSLVGVGEQYGTLDKSTAIVAEVFYDRFKQRLQRIDVLIGPFLLVMAGSLIGMIFLWVILPVYEVVALQGGIA